MHLLLNLTCGFCALKVFKMTTSSYSDSEVFYLGHMITS